MFLIVGLGNPGPRYALNRHNIGFLVVDALCDHLGSSFNSEQFKSFVAKAKIADQEVMLLKPQTFMNLSGEAVQAFMAYYKIETEKLLVIHDEIDLPFSAVRFQKNRGHGGHNGIRNIHEKLGQDYARLRMGVGRPTIPQMSVADFVLQNFNNDEQDKLGDFIGLGCEAILDFVEIGFTKAQNQYNKE